MAKKKKSSSKDKECLKLHFCIMGNIHLSRCLNSKTYVGEPNLGQSVK